MANAPTSALLKDLMADDWQHSYPRSLAAYPQGVDVATKYWPPVGRVDNLHGDRNLICSCPPIEDLAVG